jgi:hypothetical protein
MAGGRAAIVEMALIRVGSLFPSIKHTVGDGPPHRKQAIRERAVVVLGITEIKDRENDQRGHEKSHRRSSKRSGVRNNTHLVRLGIFGASLSPSILIRPSINLDSAFTNDSLFFF